MCEIKEKEYSFLSNNKYVDIHVKMWIPQEKIKAIVQISHGMAEHIERYDEFARFLASNGVLVVGNDHMGHGDSVNSEEDYGYFAIPVIGIKGAKKERFSSSSLAVKDLLQVTRTVKKHYPGIPYYLFGHSMGSMFVQRYAMQYGKEIDGIILAGIVYCDSKKVMMGKMLCKLITLIKGERHRSKIFYFLVFGSYLKKIKNRKTRYDWFTSDEESINKYMEDEKCGFIFTMNGFEALISTMGYIQEEHHINKIPKDLKVLIMSGKEDPCGNYGEYINELCNLYNDHSIEDVTIKSYENCRHEILNEKNKESVFEDIYNWIEEKR